MSSPATQDIPNSDSRPFDAAARGALLLPILSGLLWLAVGGLLALIQSIQGHTPAFFTTCEWFTYGRLQAASESVLTLGWAGNSGVAVALWLLGRLGGAKPRGLGLAWLGAVLWNLGVSAALVGILSGDATGIPLAQIPGYVYPILLAAAAAMGVTGIFAWSDRNRSEAYATQWYASAALFILPWVLSVGMSYLYLTVDRGVSSTVVGTWIGQNLQFLWLAPLLLASLYCLAPRLSGQGVSAYGSSLGGFWALILFGAFAGTRGLSGGPFPVWIPSLGIAAVIALLIHYLIVVVNLRSIFNATNSSVVARFLALSLASYLLVGLLDVAASLRVVARWTQFTYVTDARNALFLFGAFTPAILGAVYFLVPRLTGKAWASDGLIIQHFRVTLLSVIFLVGGLLAGGVVQAVLLSDKENSFASMAEPLKTWLLLDSAGIGLVLLGSVFLLVNLALQIKPECCCCSSSNVNTPANAS